MSHSASKLIEYADLLLVYAKNSRMAAMAEEIVIRGTRY
jgi:hypothetical protein